MVAMVDQTDQAAAPSEKDVDEAPTTAALKDSKTIETVDDVPDPDEDDLDDLDDMLDEFSSVKLAPTAKVPASAAPGSGKPGPAPGSREPISTVASDELPLSEDEFAKQLQAGMADLLGEMEKSPEMKAQFEEFESIFKELGAAADAHSATQDGANQEGKGGGSSFQENIRRTMERMQASGESATAAATAESHATDDFMAELLKNMQGGGEGDEEEFSKMLLGMMEQLTNKEILYEPMKELSEKFPDWLEKNKSTVSPEDLKRYKEQERLAGEIVAKFEEAAYSDSNAADRQYVVDRMQKMQAEGSPPSDLVGDMPSTHEALGAPDDEACKPQ